MKKILIVSALLLSVSGAVANTYQGNGYLLVPRQRTIAQKERARWRAMVRYTRFHFRQKAVHPHSRTSSKRSHP